MSVFITVATACFCVKYNYRPVRWYNDRTMSYDLPPPPPQAPSHSCLHFVVSSKRTGTSDPPVNVRWHKWQPCVLKARSVSAHNNSWSGSADGLLHAGSSRVSETPGLLGEHLESGRAERV